MNIVKEVPFQLTTSAINRVKTILKKEKNSQLKLRVYVTGGGCNGFQYGFKLDDKINKIDLIIEKQGASLIIDNISFQYLIGGSIDYVEDLKGSYFMIKNPNAKTNCSCGLSFSI